MIVMFTEVNFNKTYPTLQWLDWATRVDILYLFSFLCNSTTNPLYLFLFLTEPSCLNISLLKKSLTSSCQERKSSVPSWCLELMAPSLTCAPSTTFHLRSLATHYTTSSTQCTPITILPTLFLMNP